MAYFCSFRRQQSIAMPKRLTFLNQLTATDLQVLGGAERDFKDKKTAFDTDVTAHARLVQQRNEKTTKTKTEVERDPTLATSPNKQTLHRSGEELEDISKVTARGKDLTLSVNSGGMATPGLELGDKDQVLLAVMAQVKYAHGQAASDIFKSDAIKGKQLQVSVLPAGDSKLISIKDGNNVFCTFAVGADKTFQGVLSASVPLTPGVARLHPYESNGVLMLPLGNKLVVQRKPEEPVILDLPGPVNPEQVQCEVFGQARILRFQTYQPQNQSQAEYTMSVVLDDRGKPLRTPPVLKGDKIDWSATGQQMVFRGNDVDIYPALSAAGTKTPAQEVMESDALKAEIHAFCSTAETRLRVAAALAEGTDVAQLKPLSTADLQDLLKTDKLSDKARQHPEVAGMLTVLSTVSARVDKLLEAQQAHGADRAQKLSKLEEEEDRYRDAVRAICERPKPDAAHEIDYFLEQLKEIGNALTTFTKERGKLHTSGGGVLTDDDVRNSNASEAVKNADGFKKKLMEGERGRQGINSKISAWVQEFREGVEGVENEVNQFGDPPDRGKVDLVKPEMPKLLESSTRLGKLRDAYGRLKKEEGKDDDKLRAVTDVVRIQGGKLPDLDKKISDADKIAFTPARKNEVLQMRTDYESDLRIRLAALPVNSTDHAIELAADAKRQAGRPPIENFINTHNLKSDPQCAALMDQIRESEKIIIREAKDSLRIRRTLEIEEHQSRATSRLEEVLNRMAIVSERGELTALTVGIEPESGNLTVASEDELSDDARVLWEAIKSARKLKELTQSTMEDTLLSEVNSARARAENRIDDLRFYKKKVTHTDGSVTYDPVARKEDGDFGYESTGFERIHIPRGQMPPVEIVADVGWDEVVGAMVSDIAGFDDIEWIGPRGQDKYRFEVPGTAEKKGLSEHLEYEGADIGAPAVLAYRYLVVHYQQAEGEGKFMYDLYDTLEAYSRPEDKLEALQKFIRRDLVSKYGEKQMTTDMVHDVALILMPLIEAASVHDPDAVQPFLEVMEKAKGQDLDISGFRSQKMKGKKVKCKSSKFSDDYKKFNARNRVARLDELNGRIREYEDFVLDYSKLSSFTPFRLKNKRRFCRGRLEHLRVQAFKEYRDRAIDQDVDESGCAIAGPPGLGKSALVEDIDYVENSRSVWVNGTTLEDAVSWDPWSAANPDHVRNELVKVFVGMISGWHVVIDEAHNISEKLQKQLKTIAQIGGKVHTDGSPEHPVFKRLFPNGDYLFHKNSSVVLIKNDSQKLAEDGCYAVAKANETSTALAGRIPEFNIAQTSYDNQDAVLQSYLQRAALKDGLLDRQLVEYSEAIVRTLSPDPAHPDVTGRFTIGSTGNVDIDKKWKKRLVGLRVMVELERGVHRNGVDEAGNIEPTCLFAHLTPRQIPDLIKVVEAYPGDDEPGILTAVRTYILREFKDKYGKPRESTIYLDHLLFEKFGYQPGQYTTQAQAGDTRTVWKKECDEAVLQRAGASEQVARVTKERTVLERERHQAQQDRWTQEEPLRKAQLEKDKALARAANKGRSSDEEGDET